MATGTAKKRGRYLTFMLVFWLVAAILMFLDGLRSGHWNQVVIRFYYFPILGLLFSAAMTLIYRGDFYSRLSRSWAVATVIVLAGVASFLTATLLNPVTFLMLGLDIVENHLEKMSNGMVFFGIVYAFWSVVFLQLEGRPLFGNVGRPAEYVDRIAVEERGKINTIPAEDIECLLAKGDYVEIHAGGKTYLKKETISAFEALLDPEKFRRVHRSTIVNAGGVVSVKPGSNGTFDLILRSGRSVTASRSYRSVVQALRVKN